MNWLSSKPGRVHLGVRYYDPATAQFLTRDPLEAPTREPYGYVGNDPMSARRPGLGRRHPALTPHVAVASGDPASTR